MNDTLTFLSELLSVAPDVKLLVTSRVALNLQEEWLYFLGGMLSRNGGQANDLSQSSAVALFVDRARHVRPDFSRAAEERDIVRICQLVEGMPLSIELAASWTKVLSCAEIAAEIERNIDFLVATLRDIPERHRNMQAIFDQSWRLLTEEERTVFARLSIFRGGFRRAEAESITGASLALLSALVDQSLLRCEPDGRYRIHEVLRQHAYPHLNASPHAVTEVNSRHAHYYAGFLQRCLPNITGEEGPQIAREINVEIENIRQAWEWAYTTGNSDMLAQMADPLQYFFDFRGRSPEFLGMLQQALAHVQELEGVEPSYGSLALLQTYLGWSYIRVGQLATARAVMEQAQALLEQHNLLPPPVLASDPLCGLGVVANSQGDYATAHQLGTQAYERSIGRNDLGNAQLARYVQANALYNLGIYEQAQIAALDGLHIARKSGVLWFEAYLLNELGQIANALGEVARAHDYYEESRRIKAHFGDAEGMAVASINLARIALLTGDYAQAEALYSQCVVTYREIGDRGGLARARHGLGDIMMAVERYPSAQQHFHDALQIAADIEFWPVTLTILTSISQLYIKTNRHLQARQLLTMIVEHPAGVGETQERASALLAGIEGHADDIDRGANAAPMPDAVPVETITHLLAELAMDIRQAAPSADTPALATRALL